MSEALLKKAARPLIVAATLIWGSTFFIMKDTLDDVDLMFLLAFRFTFAAVLLALVFWRRWKGIDPSYWWRGGLMGVFLFAAYAVQNYGLMDTTPGKNAFFTAVYCVIVPFLYWAVDRARPDRFNVLAAALCVAGIGFVSWDGGLAFTMGDALTLCGGFLFACHIVAVSKFSQGRDIFILTAIQFASTALCCWVGTLFTEGIPSGELPCPGLVGPAVPGGGGHYAGPVVPERGAEVHRPLLGGGSAGAGGSLRGGVLRTFRRGSPHSLHVPRLCPYFRGGGELGDKV